MEEKMRKTAYSDHGNPSIRLLRPSRDRLDRRISVCPVIASPAYDAVHLSRMCLKMRAVHPSWASIRNRLANWVRITTTLQEAGGSQICIRQGVPPDAAAFEISRAAGRGLASTGAGHAQNVPNVVPSVQDSVQQTVSGQYLTRTPRRQITNSGWEPRAAPRRPPIPRNVAHQNASAGAAHRLAADLLLTLPIEGHLQTSGRPESEVGLDLLRLFRCHVDDGGASPAGMPSGPLPRPPCPLVVPPCLEAAESEKDSTQSPSLIGGASSAAGGVRATRASVPDRLGWRGPASRWSAHAASPGRPTRGRMGPGGSVGGERHGRRNSRRTEAA